MFFLSISARRGVAPATQTQGTGQRVGSSKGRLNRNQKKEIKVRMDWRKVRKKAEEGRNERRGKGHGVE